MAAVLPQRVKLWLDSMSLEDQIGQMSQIDLAILLDDTRNDLNMSRVQYYIGVRGIGSVLNNVVGHQWNASKFRSAVIKLQDVARQYNRPPVIYGLDSIHGANYIEGATLTPQPLNLAATFNISMSYRAGLLASRDTRAAGIPWLFSPLLGIALDPRWSRTYETFGEDMLLVGTMAHAMVRGIQQPGDGIPSRAAATAKHFVGYSAPRRGHDRAPSWIPKRHLYQYFLPPWKKVSKEVLSIMEAYTEYDGIPIVSNKYALQMMLRFQLEFTGVLVTDYSEIWNLVDWHHTAKNKTDAVAKAIRAGIDISMIPFDAEGFSGSIQDAMQLEWLNKDRIRKAASRVLVLKDKLNMFDEEIVSDDINIGKIGTDRREALEMARQSIILVKNENNVLPLDADDNIRVLITGPTANSLSFQTGGWTWQWQGVDDSWFHYGSTVLEAAKELSWSVTFQCGTDILGHACDSKNLTENPSDKETISPLNKDPSISIQAALMQDVDYAIVCIGEESYAEKPGDINQLDLPEGQLSLVRDLANKTKVILIYFGGRPRLLREVEPVVEALLIGFLPGPDAGKAVMDVIVGNVNPSGRLPITYPKSNDLQGVPYFHSVSEQCSSGKGPMPHYIYGICDVQWPFGFGLSYTEFDYSNLTVNTNVIKYNENGRNELHLSTNDHLIVSIRITNKGKLEGHETVMFFSFDQTRSVTPEYKRLRYYEKIYLLPSETKTVTAIIDTEDLKFVGVDDDAHFTIENGLTFRVGVGVQTDCRRGINLEMCSDDIMIKTSEKYISGCEIACDIWNRSSCLESDDCLARCSLALDIDPSKKEW
jgi:beta-glucosidase